MIAVTCKLQVFSRVVANEYLVAKGVFVEAGPPKGTGVVEDMPWAMRAAAAVLESMGLASPVSGPECLGSWS